MKIMDHYSNVAKQFILDARLVFYYFAYNFIKIHGTSRCTPALAVGVTNRLWEVSDLIALVEADERDQKEWREG
jgi:hypothetical protein